MYKYRQHDRRNISSVIRFTHMLHTWKIQTHTSSYSEWYEHDSHIQRNALAWKNWRVQRWTLQPSRGNWRIYEGMKMGSNTWNCSVYTHAISVHMHNPIYVRFQMVETFPIQQTIMDVVWSKVKSSPHNCQAITNNSNKPVSTLLGYIALWRDPSTHHLDRSNPLWTGRNMGGRVRNEGAKKVFQKHIYC